MKLVEIPEQTPASEVEPEILEIFVEEMQEVLETIISHFIAWRDDANDEEPLKVLRRAFHTLKGSGRLVGATAIGELGWCFESMLNHVIEGTLTRNDAMLKLLEQVEDVLPEMIEQFQNTQPTPSKVITLISQVQHFVETKGRDSAVGTTHSAKPKPATPATPVKSKVVPPPVVEEEEEFVEELEESDKIDAEDTPAELAALEESELEDQQIEDFAVEESESLELATSDAAADTILETVDADFSSDTAEFGINDADFNLEIKKFDTSDSELLETIELSTDELEHITLAAHETETPDKDNFSLETTDLSVKMTVTEETETEVINPVLIDIFRKEASQHLVELKEALISCQQTPSSEVEQNIIRTFHTLNGSSRSVNFSAISAIAAPLEGYMRELSERHLELTTDRLPLFQEATVLIENLLNGDFLDEKRQTVLLKQVQAALESLSESTTKTAVETSTSSTSKMDEDHPEQNDEFMAIFSEEAEEILENTQSLLERWQTTPNNMQLMKELQRELHTLKGGSRMVGIVPMGDLSHHLESVLTQIVEGNAQSNTRLQEIVQNSVDELAAMLEAVRSGVPLEMPIDLINLINSAIHPEGTETALVNQIQTHLNEPKSAGTLSNKEELLPVKPKVIEEPEPIRMDRKDDDSDAGEDRIRVRVTLIDKLTSLAGELSISRAHLEQQQAAVKNNLSEMEQTVVSLRDKLRRLEIETEAQIFSHYGRGLFGKQPIKDNKEFDPLELDRFSVMQQLSRSLMESISDLVSIQDFLKTLTRQTDTLLIQQSRIGAELQEGIMRTRMVPFARISPRLQRICRLTARELRKQVDFDINGENIEFERTVLNRMVAPLEHMLRNAIGHGIEDAETRQQAGKPTIAKIAIDLAKEGSELIIKLSDDGAGLNLVAIRKKAEEKGLLKPGTVISDHELMQFILEPSFSTAKSITQVSGRGVGMDVANSEIKQLSGSLQIHSKMGQGTVFEIRLPLSLTINQALLVHIGEETLAIPLNNVEAVMRLPRADVLTSHNDEIRHYKYMDNEYRVFHLGELLGFGRQGAVDSPLIPTLLARAGNRRVALVVDGIEGSKEVVVKSVGPQIGSIRWITGATILGDGRVVLILDVGALARAADKDKTLQRPDITPAVVEPVVEEEKPAAVATIMVVDDSITVRKVTARLLKRQGMEVLTAKDGVDAVAQLQEHVPDLMLLDVEMPRMDGYELATQIRNTPNLKHIPIIMITTRTGAKHRDKAEKIGIDRYLGKPFNETELLANINALLAEKTTIPTRVSS